MKRFFTLIIALVLVPLVALADLPDISELDYDELIQLQEMINDRLLQIMKYENITLPVGYYIVGEDIPAGDWIIQYSPGEVGLIEYFLVADASGHSPADVVNDYFYDGVGDPDHELAFVYKKTQFKMTLKEGYHFNVNYGSVILVPVAGKGF